MRLYIDEDLASKELVARLTRNGHDLVPTVRGASDSVAWARAQEESAAVVTANVRDFVALGREASHHGLLLLYREADPTKNLTIAEVAAAVEHVQAALGPELNGQVVALNHYRSR